MPLPSPVVPRVVQPPPFAGRLVLASTSPRRLDLMTEAGYDFTVVPAEVVEEHDEASDPIALTARNARLKAEWVAQRHPGAVVIGADTLVAIGGAVLGKPADLDEAQRMLGRLTGRTHIVCTAVCVVHAAGAATHAFEEITEVTFKPLGPDEIGQYLGLIQPLDKAGSYAAQEHGEFIIERVEGSWTNVVGLPMERLAAELGQFRA